VKNPTARKVFNELFLAALFCATVTLTPPPVFCADETQVTPKDFSEKSFAAMKEGKTEEFAKMMLPSELERFKSSLLSVTDMAKSKGQEQQMLMLLQVPDRSTLDKLPAEEFLVRLMKRQMTPDVLELYKKADFKSLGVVAENDDTAHCIYIIDVPDLVKKTSVVSLKKSSTGWGMLLSGDIDKMMQMLKLQFAQNPTDPLSMKPELKAVAIIGSIIDGDAAYVLIRSTTAMNGIEMHKVAVVPIIKSDPEFKLISENKKPELEKAIQKRVGLFVDLAKSAAAAYKEAADKKNESAENAVEKK